MKQYAQYRRGAIRISLSPDVQRVVDELIDIGKTHPHLDEWRLYAYAKSVLSRKCGFDAPAGQFSQHDYDLAIAKYVREVGL